MARLSLCRLMLLKQLGPYRIVRQLGRGGMGTVYEGENVQTGERAAVKVLSATLAHDPGFRERFEAEIETLKTLRHPNIVRLFGYGEQDGLLFYAMELVEGPSLEDELRHGRHFHWREATRLAVKLCRALKHAHDHGVVHRDIKPANLLLAGDGEVKLSDFGIAKLFGNSGMTTEGGVLGTAEYMSPEQAEGKPATHRCDLYSLGCVLYALVAGRPPFRSKSLPEMLQLQRFAQPDPVRRYNSEVPAELELIIDQLLQKNPKDRVANALVLARRLEAMEHALSIPQTESPRNGDPAARVRLEDDPADEELGNTVEQRTVAAEPGMPPVGESAAFELARQSEENRTALLQNEPTRAGAPSDVPPVAGSARFTTVSERSRWDTDEQPLTLGRLLQAGALLLSLLMVLGAFWYFFQPLSADALHRRIETALDGEGNRIDRLRAVEAEINDFLKRFPDDPRSEPLQRYREELELDRLERRLISYRGDLETMSPVERAYVEAINYARIEPERGMSRLRALLDLHATDQAGDDRTEQIVKLAQRRLRQLEAQLDKYVGAETIWLRTRLDEADAVAEERPRQAAAVYRGVTQRYADKPWAAPFVRRAQAALEALQAAHGEPLSAPSSPENAEQQASEAASDPAAGPTE